MNYEIRIKRQSSAQEKAYWQTFLCESDGNASVADVLRELNARTPLCDADGKQAQPIGWECSCLVRKCGACAMRINGVPRLACAVFLRDIKNAKIVLEPLSKFPLVRDLIVDRRVLFDRLKEMQVWLEGDAQKHPRTHGARYQSARCLQCGCCLEICPNFCAEQSFGGAAAAVQAFRVLDQETDAAHKQKLTEQYRRIYYEGCGKSLACQDICPAGIPIEELMVRSNAAAIWKR